MNMNRRIWVNFFGTKINKDYAWEIGFLYFIRNFSDGLTGFSFLINFDKYKGDHNPKFNVALIIFNFLVFDFSIYNTNHV